MARISPSDRLATRLKRRFVTLLFSLGILAVLTPVLLVGLRLSLLFEGLPSTLFCLVECGPRLICCMG